MHYLAEIAPKPPFHQLMMNGYYKLIDNKLIFLLFLAIMLDIGTGLLKSLVQKSTQGKPHSTKGIIGVLKHMTVFFSIVIIYPYFDIQGLSVYVDSFVLAVISTYAISIAENWGQAKLPGYQYLSKYLAKLQDDYDGRTDSEKLTDILNEIKKERK
ncbi:phage holin family protein [Ligilactobacillus salivarius]|uniref:phage holin family protein n=1 Tax=Ligilactobacillus salivarius TaxID=1624 RepID=UPI00235F5A34|nr:phage holin family protein [Ligilactobacillus salivarius]MDD1403480.1 phage holin family protein [Ligilactobacillus salivarius]